MSRWISVKKRLPRRPGQYLAYEIIGDVGEVNVVGYAENLGGWQMDPAFITHWMPLPEPPRTTTNSAEDGKGAACTR